MVQKTLEKVIEECSAAVPLLTKLTFTKLAEKFDMSLDEFLAKTTQAFMISNVFGDSAVELLIPEFTTMEQGMYAFDNYSEELFSQLYKEVFGEEVEITND